MNALGPRGIARRYPLGALDRVESPLPGWRFPLVGRPESQELE